MSHQQHHTIIILVFAVLAALAAAVPCASNAKFFRYFDDPKTWSEARDACAASVMKDEGSGELKNGVLASVMDQRRSRIES